MSADATGTPTTTYSFPKFATGTDTPNGKGVNQMMDDIDTKLTNRLNPSSVTTNGPVYWNGSTWVSAKLTTTQLSAAAAIVGTQLSGSANILGSQLSASAAIAGTQLAANTVAEAQITAGTITNASINAAAGITYGKLNLGGNVVNADVSASAAITPQKITSVCCVVYRSTGAGSQNFAAADGTISFDTALTDTSTFWAGGNPTRITMPYTGKYRIRAKAAVSGTQGGSYRWFLRKNGATNVLQQSDVGTSTTIDPHLIENIITLTASDYVEAFWSHGTSTGMTTQTNIWLPVLQNNTCGWIEVEFLGA